MTLFFFESCIVQDEMVDYALLEEGKEESKICIAYKKRESFYAVFPYKDINLAKERFNELLIVLNEVGKWKRENNTIIRL